MNLLSAFHGFIKDRHLFQHRDRLLVAVSGGVDSIVLCELCKQAGYDFSIAHCNFKLRDADSDADEAFVRDLAKRYNVPFYSEQFDTRAYALEKKLSIQEAARDLRYSWFKELLENDFGNVLLTAHHADDNIETLLMNFFKGTGITGLVGIPARTKGSQVSRPLLFATKGDIMAFAASEQLEYREDLSNSSNKYTRNYFRNELIPGLEKVFPQVRGNLRDNLTRFNEAAILYRQAIDAAKKKLLFQQPGGIFIPVLKLVKTPAMQTVLFEIVSQFDFKPGQLQDIKSLLHADSGKYVQSATHRILRNRKWLIISPLQSEECTHYLVEKIKEVIVFPKGCLSAEVCEFTGMLPTEKNTAMLKAASIKFPLMLRKWKTGDYFYPLGMKHKKKLSRFFIDNKFSLLEKENTWVVEMDKKIIWIVNQRIDERFRVDEKTKRVLKLVYTPN